jgi:hypothetical protein
MGQIVFDERRTVLQVAGVEKLAGHAGELVEGI